MTHLCRQRRGVLLMKRCVLISLLLFGTFVAGRNSGQFPANAQEDDPKPLANLNGDVNCDNNRDLSDAVYTLAWLFLGGAEPCGLNDHPELAARISELEGQ